MEVEILNSGVQLTVKMKLKASERWVILLLANLFDIYHRTKQMEKLW